MARKMTAQYQSSKNCQRAAMRSYQPARLTLHPEKIAQTGAFLKLISTNINVYIWHEQRTVHNKTNHLTHHDVRAIRRARDHIFATKRHPRVDKDVPTIRLEYPAPTTAGQ